MTRTLWIAALVLAAAGCGTPSAPLRDDQTVTLTDGSPIQALLIEPQPKDYLINLEVTANRPIDFAVVPGNLTLDQALELRGKDIGLKQAYRKTASSHTFEGGMAANTRPILLLRHVEGSGPTSVRVKRTR